MAAVKVLIPKIVSGGSRLMKTVIYNLILKKAQLKVF